MLVATDAQRSADSEPKTKKPTKRPWWVSLSLPWSITMATPAPRRRKTAVTPMRETVKTSIVLDVELAAKLAAAAALRRCTQNAIVVEALTESIGGIVVFDRKAKSAGQVTTNDRQGPGLSITPDADSDAA
jgi:hypothetical protein